MLKRLSFGVAALAVTMALAGSANALTGWTLTNTPDPNGGAVTTPAGALFELFGPSQSNAETTYTTTYTGTVPGTVEYRFHYTSPENYTFEQPGYSVNQSDTNLTNNGGILGTSTNFSGLVTFNLQPGDTYGFYINNAPLSFYQGTLTINSVPEPATWGLMLLGVGMVGAALRRRARGIPAV